MEAKKKDRQQEQQDRRQEEQDEQQEEKDRRQEEQDEQQKLLDYAIEYCTCESYPPGLTKDKKDRNVSIHKATAGYTFLSAGRRRTQSVLFL